MTDSTDSGTLDVPAQPGYIRARTYISGDLISGF